MGTAPEIAVERADEADAKAELRRAALAARDAMPMTARIEASLALAEHADRVAPEGSTVAAYWPIRSEIDPRPLLFALHEAGYGMALPVVLPSGMVFRRLVRGAPLEPAGFGTHAPTAEAGEVVPDTILLPLAAFDRTGQRIGYGQGHYDRAIARLREGGHRPRLVGLAFAVQEVTRVPAEPHDEPLDAVLTERGPVGGRRA